MLVHKLTIMLTEMFIGFVLGSTIIWISFTIYKLWITTTPIEIDYEELCEGEAFDEARCPDCGSYDLDRYKGVEWMRGGDDGDHFECKQCGRSFSDEEWENVVKTDVNLGGVQD